MKRTPKTLLTSILIAAMLASCSPNVPSEPVDIPPQSEASLSQSEIEISSESSSEESSSEASSESTSSESESSETSSESTSSESVSSESSSSAEESSSQASSQEQSAADPQKTPYSENGVTLSQTAVRQGCFMKIRVEGRNLSGRYYTDFYGRTHEFFEFEGAWYSLIAIDPADEPGKYPLVINLGDYVFEKEIEVVDRKFRQQYLEVAQYTLDKTLENPNARAEFNAFVEYYLGYKSNSPLWGGKFMYPLGSTGYSETTKFGSFRTFSNGATEWHNATDMAVTGGTPIYATNSGSVIFAGHLDISGNTVLIDHGAGVISWHYHLKEIFVTPGSFVTKGDQIGTVGTTGLSTGNHLHFGISVDGIFTDPMQVVSKRINLDFGANLG